MIRIICVGKVKESFYKEAILEYKKRISKYSNIEIIEVMDEGLTDIKTSLKKECERILKVVNLKDYIITLEIDGQTLSSTELAQKIDNIYNTHSNITFIIGGSYGLDDKIKEISNFHLSFSKLTFPHQLFRIILLEQIYRSFKINNNESYHK